MKRLWLKIFLGLIIANALFATLLYLGFTWSFEIAFKRYLEDQEQARFAPLISSLKAEYRSEGSWNWVVDDHERWRQLMAAYIVRPGEAARSPVGQPPGRRAPNGQPPGAPPNGGSSMPARPADGALVTNNGMNPHLVLFDAEGQMVLGNAETNEQIYRFPIEENGVLLGEVGVRAETRLTTAMQTVIENQSNHRLMYILAGLLGVSSLFAFGLATWLTRRIYRLKGATTKLVRGSYDHRLAVYGRDVLDSLAEDFNDLAKTLQENRSAHRRWIASTSHELRTPVTILQGQIEALRDGIRTVTPDYLEGLVEDINRLNLLVDDLHQLSMSDLGALDYRKDHVDLAELIDDELGKFQPILPEQLSLSWQLQQDETVCVLGDAGRLAQLIVNLMQNSIRYTDLPGNIQVSLMTTANTVTLVWQDSAPGVAEEECHMLTQPLYRTDASRSRTVAGSGLGLAIVQAIVKAHEGSLEASPSPLGGLRWRITFSRVKG